MNRNDFVYSVNRRDDRRWGSAGVTVRLHIIGDDDKFHCRATVNASAYDGDAFDDDDTCTFNFYGETLSQRQASLDIVKALFGREDVPTVGNLKTALARSNRGFYDRRTRQWRPISDRDKIVFELRTPYISWYADDEPDAAQFSDIRHTYADSEEKAKKDVYKRFLDADRLDLVEERVTFYETRSDNHEPMITLSELFAPAPLKPEPVDEEESEVELA